MGGYFLKQKSLLPQLCMKRINCGTRLDNTLSCAGKVSLWQFIVNNSISSTLLRGGIIRTLAFLVSIIAALILMPFLIHGLGERSYGMWATIGTVVAYYSVMDFGLASTNEKFMAQSFALDSGKRSSIVFSTSVVASCWIGLFFAAITLAVSSMSPTFFSDAGEIHQFRYAFLILGLNFSLSFPFYAVEGALAAKLLYDKLAMARIATTVFRTIVAIVVVNSGYSLIALAIVILATSTLFRTIILTLLRRHIPNLHFSFSNFSKPSFWEMFKHGKYVFLGNISSNAHFRLSNVIVSSVAGLGAVTMYAVAARLSEYLQSLVQRVFQIFLPVLTQIDANDSTEDFEKAFWATFELNIVSTVCLFGLAVVLGQNFIWLWLGPGFEISYQLFLILSCGLALKHMQVSSLQALMARSRHKNSNLYELVESIIAILLAVILGREIGLTGIAIGIVIPMLINKVIFQPIIRCKDLNLSLRRYYATMVKCSAPTILMFVLCWLVIRDLGQFDIFSFVATSFVCMAVTIPAGFLSLPGNLRRRIIAAVLRKPG